MTTRDGFTRLVDTWLAEEGVLTTPDYLDEVLVRTSAARQRPAWLSPGRWLPVDTTTLNPRAYSIPPAVRYGVLAALLIGLVVAAAVLFAGAQRHRVPAPFGPAANGRIYFDVDGNIVTANADGTGRQTIDLGGNATAPYLSPDGTKFAFVLTDPLQVGADTMRVAEADGSHQVNISGGISLDIDPAFNPTWSPDSSRLAFASFSEGMSQLFVANADGSGAKAIGDRDAWARQNPEWSPSGDWIAYMAWPSEGGTFLAAIHPDGTGDHLLPTSDGAGQGFRGWQLWAPDLSNRLAYAIGARDETDPKGFNLGDAIATMDVDTGVETIVSDEPGTIEHRPAWSPDGSLIAFHFGDQMAVIKPDGTGRRVLKDTLNGSVGWSPDGNWVLGKSTDDLEVEAIDAIGDRAPVKIPLNGPEQGVFSWQRLAP